MSAKLRRLPIYRVTLGRSRGPANRGACDSSTVLGAAREECEFRALQKTLFDSNTTVAEMPSSGHYLELLF